MQQVKFFSPAFVWIYLTQEYNFSCKSKQGCKQFSAISADNSVQSNHSFVTLAAIMATKQKVLKLYYLSTCDTCARIMKEVGIKKYPFHLQDIKTEKISEKQIDEMKSLAGSYESLFSRIALKYRAWKLNEKNLNEEDYKRYILEEYTFLKRPVFIIGAKIFIGNAPKNILAIKAELAQLKI